LLLRIYDIEYITPSTILLIIKTALKQVVDLNNNPNLNNNL